MKPVSWKILAGIAFLTIAAYAKGPHWEDKNGTVHDDNIVFASKAKSYGVDENIKPFKGYIDVKVIIRVESKCWFLANDRADGGFKRSEWRVIGENTVEINFGPSGYPGVGLGICDGGDRSKSWNVFGADPMCSPIPNVEYWTVKRKINGRWVVTARQKFYIEP